MYIVSFWIRADKGTVRPLVLMKVRRSVVVHKTFLDYETFIVFAS